MNYLKLVEKYYKKDSLSYNILIKHSKLVAKKALEIAKNVPKLNPNLELIKNGALVHDIGIFKTKAENIGCFGIEPYIKHGILGYEILIENKLENLANFALNHIGVGITKKDIIEQNLPLPLKDFVPKTIEEEIVCLADKFYSKNPKNLEVEFTISQIENKLKKFGKDKVITFRNLCKKYKLI